MGGHWLAVNKNGINDSIMRRFLLFGNWIHGNKQWGIFREITTMFVEPDNKIKDYN